MLKLRVITALVLLALLIPAVAWPNPEAFSLVALVFIAAAMWEWWRLAGGSGRGGVVAAIVLAAAGLGLLASGLWRHVQGPVFPAAAVVWVIASALALHTGVDSWKRCPFWIRRMAGVLALLLAWWAVSLARLEGINFLFSVLALVWAADIGAYFFGRAMGGRWFRRKLAVTISPGKTWEGALGGALCVFLLAYAWRLVDVELVVDSASVYTRLAQQGALIYGFGLALLVAMSVVGDLMESLIKRAAGVKDSSALLPGHGGVLDRVDALLPVLPIALGMVL